MIIEKEDGTTVEGEPTQHLVRATTLGYAEAWPQSWPNFDGTTWVQWRLRDDGYDAERKPADVPYTRVRVR